MSRCLKLRARFADQVREPTPKALDALSLTLIRLATRTINNRRMPEHVRLRVTHQAVAAAIAGRFETLQVFIGCLSKGNKNVLRQALEENGFVFWDPKNNRPLRF